MSGPDREETIFNSLLALPPERRQEHLDRECAGDADLRRRVIELLEAHDGGDRFMAASAAETLTGMRVPISEKPGDCIGRYKLMEQIGEGGCGVVYVAEQQEPVRRRVALKLIKLGMDTKQVMARFEAERQALALIEHANIAKVLDAGATESGRRVSVSFVDTGVGIAPEHLQRIFDLYFTTKEKGTGIGLSMVSRIVQLNDGEVEVQSTPGRGTRFRLVFPQA